MAKKSAKLEYPSAEVIFPLAVASYETAQKRLDAVEKRLQEILAFALTVTFAVITIFAGKNINFYSVFFVLAIVFCFLGIGVSIYARLGKQIILIKPSILFERHLTKEVDIFQKDFIYFAGEHWDHNVKIINFKGDLSNISAFLFLAEFMFLGVWAVTGVAPTGNP